MNGTNQPPMLPQPKKKVWLWVIIAIVALVVLVVAYYVFYSAPAPEGSAPAADETASIEQDLQATNLNGLGAELNSINKELSQ